MKGPATDKKTMTTAVFVKEANKMLEFLRNSGLLSHPSPHISYNAERLNAEIESKILMPFSSNHLINWQEVYNNFEQEINELKKSASKRTIEHTDTEPLKSQKTTESDSPLMPQYKSYEFDQEDDNSKEESSPKSFVSYAMELAKEKIADHEDKKQVKNFLILFRNKLINEIDQSPLNLEEKKDKFQQDFNDNLEFLRFVYKYRVKLFLKTQKKYMLDALQDNISNDQEKFISDRFENIKNEYKKTEELTKENIDQKLLCLPYSINKLLEDFKEEYGINVEAKHRKDGMISGYNFISNNDQSTSSPSSTQATNDNNDKATSSFFTPQKNNNNLANDSGNKIANNKETRIIENKEYKNDKSFDHKLEHIEIANNNPEIIKQNQKHVLKMIKKLFEYNKKHVSNVKIDWTKDFATEEEKESPILEKLQTEKYSEDERIEPFESLPSSWFEYIPEILKTIDLQEYIKKSLNNHLILPGSSGIDFSVHINKNLLENIGEVES